MDKIFYKDSTITCHHIGIRVSVNFGVHEYTLCHSNINLGVTVEVGIDLTNIYNSCLKDKEINLDN
jgi:hypothetical protein